MSATGYTGNPPGSGGGGGPVAISDVTGLTAALAAKAALASPTFTGTVAGITASMVGLGSVDNTADTAKPVSTAQASALALKAPLASPTFTGTVAGITAAMVGLGNVTNTSDTAKPVSTAQQTALDLKADLASPALTGNPTAPTQTAGNNTTRVATTAFVTAAVAAGGGGGGGTAATFARDNVTSGDIIMANSGGVFVPITGLTLALPAAIGDDVELFLSCLATQGSSESFELVVLVGGSIVRYSSTGTGSTTTAGEGDPSMYPLSGAGIKPLTTIFSFTAASGDISGGNITFALAYKGPGSGSGKVYASTNYPFRWRARNDH